MNFSYKKVVDKHNNLVSTPRKITTKFLVTGFKALLYIVVVGIAAVGFGGLGMVKGIIDSAPNVEDINIAPVGYATEILYTDGNVSETLTTAGSNREQVSIDQIPECLQNAFIAIEDERFRDHKGIDIKGILRAGVMMVTTQSMAEGASTITQQLIKNNVFEDGGRESTLGALIKRKVQEQYLALELEKVMSKDIILENYLNTINLGAGNYGVQAASKRYFNIDVSKLNVSQSAVIAAITQKPTKYNPITHPDENAKRRAKILSNMKDQGYITAEEYDAAIADDVYASIQLVNQSEGQTQAYTYFVDMLVKQLIQDLQDQKGYTYTQAQNALYSGGLTIYSTQDSAMQTICDNEISNDANYPARIEYSFSWAYSVEHKDGTVENFSNTDITYYHKTLLKEPAYKLVFSSKEDAQKCIDEYKAAYWKEGDTVLGEKTTFTPQPQASFTLIDQTTGYVKAIVGGRGTKENSLSLNRATGTTRQPGSCFKVLSAFAPALDRKNETLATAYDDEPFNDTSGRPISNWWGDSYRGLSTIREAIRDSMNIVAVKTLTAITPQLGYEYLLDFGFTTLVTNLKLADGTTKTDVGQSLALGGITQGVTNLELCAAYATIANGGVYTEPVFYTKVTDQNGRVILENEPKTHTVLKESTAFLLTNAMHDVVTIGTGTLCNLKDQYVAGKTGTTTNNNDIWFVGYTPYLTASIWSGYDENKDIGSNTSYHKRIWAKIMSEINTTMGYAYKEPTVPDTIEQAQVCKKSGLLPIEGVCSNDPGGNQVITEYFAKGTVPTDTCDAHAKYTICSISGKLANSNCPAASRIDKIFRIRKPDANGTTADTPYTIPSELKNSTCILH